MARVFFLRRSSGLYLRPAYSFRRLVRWLLLTTVRTRAIDFRTILLCARREGGREGGRGERRWRLSKVG